MFVGAVSGYSAAYYAAQAGTAPEREAAGSYYVKEGPGRWFGRGVDALGLHEGAEVEIELDEQGRLVEAGAFFSVFDQQRHPETGEVLGRSPNRRDADGNRVTSRDEQLRELLAAEPHADARRLRQLAAQASRQTRPSPKFTDVTVAFSKSISVLHASIRVNQQIAEEAGDTVAAAYWAGRDAVYQEVLHAANLAALKHAERYTMTRTGYHGGRVDGRELGKWVAADPVVTSWLQGTSREGDPHDHVHNLFARMVRTADDGRWRALDTMALREQLPAMAAIATARAESGLTREFGVEWVARVDGAGNEIRGITQAQMDAFSARRQEIDAELAERADEFAETYGRAPSRAELMHLRDMIKVNSRRPKAERATDWAQNARAWNARLRGALAPVAEESSAMRAPGTWREHAQARAAQWEPTREICAQAARVALATVQAQRATWGRAELRRAVDRALPAESRQLEEDALEQLAAEVTEVALRGEFERVVSLDAPEWPALPDYLRREDLDGRSIYTRPGTERFATGVQLTLEERLIASARRDGAPRLSRADAARALGADADALDAALNQGARDARKGERTATGLRLDQGASAYHLLTSPRTAEVLVGPAGAGKTHTLAQVSRTWAQSGRHVVGLATSQMGANALREAGIDHTLNTAQFLGHLPGARGARGAVNIPAESLIIVDEASMISTPDLADITDLAVAGGHKLIVSGDHAQLSAVESGGAMSLLVSRLGHVQLGEAQRFEQAWEAEASLRIREGDAAALDEYASHGRLRGGTIEQVKAEARRMYVAEFAQGTDVDLILWRNEDAAELARAIQDDLRHLGLVDATGPLVPVGAGAEVGAGDVIRIVRNDARRGVANNELLRIERVNADGSVTVRRDGGRDKGTGQKIWAAETEEFYGYGAAELAYATSAHSAQGETTTVGLPLVTGGESAEWLYSAMTRGAGRNVIFTVTEVRTSDPAPGSRSAPELAEHERVQAERAGQPVPWPAPDPERDQGDVRAVLSGVMEHSGAESAALDVQLRNLANADHLAVLHTMWQGETAGLIRERYRQIVAEQLPEGTDPALLDTAQSTWLWRTLRQAEAAGMDPQAVVARALADRSLAGVRDLPSVIDARIRRQAGPMLPVAPKRWAEQVPPASDPDKQRFLEALAEAMDAKRERIGEDAAANERPWAVNALGAVPEDPLARLEWEQRAAAIGSYRQMHGWEHPAEPCGPEPSAAAPGARQAWHEAYAALQRVEPDDMSRHGDGTLLRMRQQYAREYEWAPSYPAAELEAVRGGVIDQDAAAVRAEAEAAAARQRGEEDLAARHELIAASSRAAAKFYRERASEGEAVMADRAEWDQLTEGTRNLAVRADAEYRRRHPAAELEPLSAGEAEHQDGSAEAVLPEPIGEAEAAERTAQMAEARERFRAEAEARANVLVPHEDPDLEPLGEAWPMRQAWARDAVLQPPKPEIRPSEGVLQAFAAREAEQEAGLEAGI